MYSAIVIIRLIWSDQLNLSNLNSYNKMYQIRLLSSSGYSSLSVWLCTEAITLRGLSTMQTSAKNMNWEKTSFFYFERHIDCLCYTVMRSNFMKSKCFFSRDWNILQLWSLDKNGNILHERNVCFAGKEIERQNVETETHN